MKLFYHVLLETDIGKQIK